MVQGSLKSVLRIQNPRHQSFFLALHIGNLHLDAVAGGDFGRFAAAFHRLQNYGLVAGGVDDFQRVADGKAVFHVHRGPAVGVDGADLADILALLGERMAFEIVLVFLRLVAFEKAGGVAAVGQTCSTARRSLEFII